MIKDFEHDKSTVFSIVPYSVKEFRPGLFPGNFTIPPCTNDQKPHRLLVGSAEHLMHISDQKKPVRIDTPSFVVARSIVTDFLDGQLWTTTDAHPGIAWKHGDVSISDFLIKHKEDFDEMRRVQKNWYVLICKKTTDEWNKYKNSRVITDQARFAAKVLGLSPEWLSEEVAGFQSDKCPACGVSNLSTNAVCSNCRCILNEAKFKTLRFADMVK
jgi:hypothetical protein